VALTWALYLIAGIVWLASGRALEYPAFGVVLLELVLTAWVIPGSRFALDRPLSPKNWALFLFYVHLLVAPLLGMVFGFEAGTLTRLPDVQRINEAMWLSAGVHLCFVIGVDFANRNAWPLRRLPEFSLEFERALAFVFCGLGALGLALTFGSIGGFLQYITVPETHAIMLQAPPTVQGALGTFLRPFLPFGLILLWSTRVQRHSSSLSLWSTLALLVALIPATASYNRASMVGPVLTVLAAYSHSVGTLSTKTVVTIGAALLLTAVAFGSYRNANLAGPDTPVRASTSNFEEANAFLQVYGEGPQFVGFLLEQIEHEPLHLGRSLVGSLLYPVPVLGKDFRDVSGVHFYNRLIYGQDGIVDQVIPASGEWLLNFHLLGVAIFFAALGFLIQQFQQLYIVAPTAFIAASHFYIGMWLAFPIAGSVAVVSQMLVYSFWPFYAYFGLRCCLRASLRNEPTLRSAPC
jgi:hypothetical protein